jgi:hypothetical protein
VETGATRRLHQIFMEAGRGADIDEIEIVATKERACFAV